MSTSDSPRPNFLIVGAPKAGTTSLYAWLKQHPEAFLPRVKEPHYFLHKKGIADWERYLALFAAADGRKAIGEASPSYLAAPEAPGWIREALGPSVRVVILLREPVARAFSSYSHRLMEGLEDIPTFEQALVRERRLIESGATIEARMPRGYCQRGLYYEQVRRYLDTFDRPQVGIWLFEDVTRDKPAFFAAVCRFLGIDDGFSPVFSPANVTRLPRSVALQGRLRRLRDTAPLPPLVLLARAGMRANVALGRAKERLSPQTRAWLKEYYRADVERLSALIGRDLSAWLAAPVPAVAGGATSGD